MKYSFVTELHEFVKNYYPLVRLQRACGNVVIRPAQSRDLFGRSRANGLSKKQLAARSIGHVYGSFTVRQGRRSRGAAGRSKPYSHLQE